MPDYTITAMTPAEAPGTRVIHIAGAMTIPNISAIRDELLTGLAGADTAILRMEDVNDIDITGLQLFCSAHLSFLRTGRRIAVQGSHIDILHTAAENAGLPRDSCCISTSPCHCLWSGGGLV